MTGSRPGGFSASCFRGLIPAVVAGGFVYGFAQGNMDRAKDAALYWVLANGVLTALGCFMAFGHPLTAISGFVAAPITSLNPTIGAGFVTAFVQTMVVKPPGEGYRSDS